VKARRSWTLVAALSAAGSLASAQAPPVFRTEVGFAYVDVFVSQGGRSVPGLRASNFELQDNGVVQQVELLASETRPVQAVLVFDSSSSVAGDKLVALRSAGEAFLNGLRPADEAALVTFSEEIAWPVRPGTDKQNVRAALGRLHPEGATAAFDALFSALTLSDPRGRALIAMFTDGDDNLSILGAPQLRKVAERSNALVHVVGPPARTERSLALKEIAERSGGRFWTPDSPERLREAFAAIAASMSERYVLRYTPQGVEREGWHELTVRLRGAKGKVQARRGYWLASR
jgi:VWFA-related protein